jgi:hypothetical protein
VFPALDYHGFIYKTIFPNGKIYIGQTTLRKNKTYFGSGVICVRMIKKYGARNLNREILKFADNQKELDKWEQVFILKFNSTNIEFGYNILPGTANKFGSINPSRIPEVSMRISQSMKKKNLDNPNMRKENSDRQKKWYIDNPNRKEEIRLERIEYYKKNPQMSEQIRQKIFGKIHSDKTKQKMSNSHNGRRWINDGEVDKFLHRTKEIPQGYKLGRLWTNNKKNI